MLVLCLPVLVDVHFLSVPMLGLHAPALRFNDASEHRLGVPVIRAAHRVNGDFQCSIGENFNEHFVSGHLKPRFLN
jgi:hypothetical protein